MNIADERHTQAVASRSPTPSSRALRGGKGGRWDAVERMIACKLAS